MQGTGKGGVGMNRNKWIAALVAVGLLALGWPVRAQVGADGVKYQTATGTRLIGVQSDSTQKLLKTDVSGNLKTTDASRDRDLDFYQTLITSTALDSTAAAGASTVYSAAIDLREYDSRSGNIIVKVTFGAADTTQAATIDYAIAAYALPTQALDWTGYGVPVAAFSHDYVAGVANVNSPADTLGGHWQSAGIVSTGTYPGEQLIRLRARPAPLAYLIRQNLSAATCISVPLGMLLAPYQRVRFLAVSLRCTARATTAVPTVRVDFEALR